MAWRPFRAKPLSEPMLNYCQWDPGKKFRDNWFNTWGRDKMAAIFQTTFSNAFVQILTNISLNFVLYGQVDHKSALVQIMLWRRPGDEPSSSTSHDGAMEMLKYGSFRGVRSTVCTVLDGFFPYLAKKKKKRSLAWEDVWREYLLGTLTYIFNVIHP